QVKEEAMAQMSRRELIGSAAAVGGVVATVKADAFGETQQPPFGPTAAPLAGAELPSFRFALGAQAWKSFEGGSAKEAPVANFPKREVYIVRGPVPPPLPADPAAGSLNTGALTHRYRLLAQRPTAFTGGTQRIVSEREFPISTTMTGGLLRIKPGAVRELHW